MTKIWMIQETLHLCSVLLSLNRSWTAVSAFLLQLLHLTLLYIPLCRSEARVHAEQPQLGFQSWIKTLWEFAVLGWRRWRSATGALTGPTVLLWQKVVGQRWGVGQTLHGRVEEARVPEVMEAGSHPVHTLPFQGKFVPWKQHLLRGGDAITLTPKHIFWDLKTETGLMRLGLRNDKLVKAFL